MNKLIVFFTLVTVVLTSCGTDTKPAPENYAAITLNDGTRGLLYLSDAHAKMLQAGDRVYARSISTNLEAELHPVSTFFLVTDVHNDSLGTLRGNTIIDSSSGFKSESGVLATPATIDSLFQVTI